MSLEKKLRELGFNFISLKGDGVCGYRQNDVVEAASLVELAEVAEHSGPRTFVLRRTEDETGVSGTGDVAWGVAFPDGAAVTRWCVSDVRQTCVWANIKDVEFVHGHHGKTRIVYLDEN